LIHVKAAAAHLGYRKREGARSISARKATVAQRNAGGDRLPRERRGIEEAAS
jgi:hypothetical protein